MKFLIIACLVASAASAKLEKLSEAEQKACVGVYLEGGKLTTECDDVITSLRYQVTKFVIGDTSFDWSVNCIKENMKNYNVFDFFLHLEYEQQPGESLSVQLLEIDVRNTVQSICRRWYGFDSFFEQILMELKSKRGDAKYPCMYKYSIEKNFIDKSVFDFDTSAFASFNCTSYFAQFDEEFMEKAPPQDLSPSKFDKCVTRKSAGYHFLRGMELITAIGTFDLTEKQKESFKEIYSDWFTGLERYTMECVRDVYKKD